VRVRSPGPKNPGPGCTSHAVHPACALSASLSLSLQPLSLLRRLGGLPLPPPPTPPPYARCRGLRRYLRRRRAPTRYSHPFSSLPFLLCETEHPNPNLNLFGYLMSTSFEIFAKIIGCTCPFTGSALVLVLTVAATSRYCLQYFLQ